MVESDKVKRVVIFNFMLNFGFLKKNERNFVDFSSENERGCKVVG